MFGFLRYDRPGPGIDPKAPKKTGLALFFDILYREFWGMMMLNCLFIAGCLPIVTAGASFSAMYGVLIRMIRDKPGDVWPEFWQGFRKNWCTGSLLFFGLVMAFLVMCVGYWFYQSAVPPLSFVVLWMAFILGMAVQFLFPLFMSVELPLKNLIKNSFFLSILALKSALASLFSLLLLGGLTVLFLYPSLLWLMFFGFVFPAYVNCFLTYPVILTQVIEGKNPSTPEE